MRTELVSGTLKLPVITVSHRFGAYPIAFESLEAAIPRLPEKARVLTDSNVMEAWGHLLPPHWPVLKIEPGEPRKSLETYRQGLEWLAAGGADRSTPLIALGGGVVGDLGGFLAATYMRGVPFIQIPTTLLAQVDSSVGGKVGVDLPQGKNLAGAFYPPVEVVVSLESLTTLPTEEFANGMAEVWKYGFAVDADLLETLDEAPLTAKSPQLGDVVRRCIQLKADIVQEDELDLSGKRAVLNFGHTVGHALEAVSGYEEIRHGEAVAIGMVAEARLGERLGMTPRGTAEAIAGRLQRAGLPTQHPHLGHPGMIAAMRNDKKASGGEIAACLLTRLGECKLVSNVPAEEVEAALCAP